MKKILIISAMADVELNYLMQKLENKKAEEHKLCKFYVGNIGENEIILCDSKIGLINTSAALTIAIEKYNPDYIINQGCAGGIGKNIHKSDLVIGIECINITSIKTKYRKAGEGSNVDDWELINFIAGEEDRLIPQKASKELIDLAKSIEKEYNYGKVHYGVIGSGDIWNSEYDRLVFLNEKYNILCEEMEGIAVYTIANQYNIPAIDIRVISDNLILEEEYERGISYKVQEFTERLILKI